MTHRAPTSMDCPDLLVRVFWLVWKEKGDGKIKDRPARWRYVVGLPRFLRMARGLKCHITCGLRLSFQRLAVWHSADER